MSDYRVSYKKEYNGVVEEFSAIKEARKPYDAKREVQHFCQSEAYDVMQELLKEETSTIVCGGYGKDIGLWYAKTSSSPLSKLPRKGKLIIRYFDFVVAEIN